MPASTPQHILIAQAWPYANGSLHLGHITAFLGADILARYHRLKGDSVLFVSGSDCYGTPIAVEAAAQQVSPATIAEKYHQEFRKTLINDLSFSYDHYGATTDVPHREFVQDIFLSLHKKGHLYTKKDTVLFSPSLNQFLPDRFVEGECPHCGFASARGDQCDECGRLLDARSLKNPHANPKIFGDRAKQGERLEERESEHFYLRLSAFQDEIGQLVEERGGAWRQQAAQFTKRFVENGLQDRPVTRDTDWGIPIPIDGYDGKRIYVWFEAVLGYLSAAKVRAGADWDRWWRSDKAKHYYVHGKDNILFHTVILPAILVGSDKDLHLPDAVFSSEYLLLEGRQFSTSRNYAVWAHEFCRSFDGELLRYFLTVQGPETSDTNFQWSSFGELVNGELIGTFGNLVHRICSFVEKHVPEGVTVDAMSESAEQLCTAARQLHKTVGEHIESGQFRKALRSIIEVAEAGNRFAQQTEPWKRIQEDRERATSDLAVLLHVIHTLSIAVQPFLPKTSKTIQSFFGGETVSSDQDSPTKGAWGKESPTTFKIRSTAPLFQKIEEAVVEKQKEALSGE
ncbi:MAG: methionine--tRNA ligase [Candidatus Kaiserbacteria bacterium]|nr:methionine--tRNA ligase [Candidatus Kaiserbacteria bacterium]